MRNPTLRHVYASLAELNDTLIRGGATALTDAGNNARKLEMLDEVSRLIDTKAHRGSGFGPWFGTKYYDGIVRDVLWLRADIDDLDSLSITASWGATPVTPVVDTDYYLAGLGGYEQPWRKIILHGQGVPTHFGSGYHNVAVAGTWSYPYRTRLLTATTSETLDASETVIDVSSITELSPGMCILIGTEQMYVSVVTDATPDTITVERGVNGTTAATHITASPISRFVYDPTVNTLALRLAMKRWKARDAGSDGSDGGGDIGSITPAEGEDTILRRMLAPVRLVGNV